MPLHVLGPLLAGCCAAVLLWRPRHANRRLRGVRPVPAARQRRRIGPRAAAALGGAAVATFGGFPIGVALGVAVAVGGPHVLGRLEPAAARADRRQLSADVPLALDLLAACLAGGAAPASAAAGVAAAVPGPAGERLRSVAAALAVGTAPADAWARLARDDPDDAFGPAARALSRAAEGGAPVAAVVSRLAVDARADARSRSEQAARRLGVLVVAPLGGCFLPAFVLLGIVPVVLGLAAPLFAGL